MNTVGALLRDAGIDVDALGPRLATMPVPAGLDYALAVRQPPPSSTSAPAGVPEGRIVVLAGPEVVRTRCVAALHAFAAAANAPVANTWGAKGVFRWDSPHHMGTCALQARDFELLRFADYDLIVATGIDPLESAPERYALAPVLEVDPLALADLAARVAPAPGPIPANALYTRLAAVAQPGFVDDRVPLHPARAVADVRAVLPPDGIVLAQPGLAGLWVARTFPTTDPGTVVVPAVATPGIAAALALVASRRGRSAIAVTTEPLDRVTLDLLERAAELAASFTIDVWSPGGSLASAAHHVEQLRTAAGTPGVRIVDVPVDLSLTDALIEAAGPVVAWGGLPLPGLPSPGC